MAASSKTKTTTKTTKKLKSSSSTPARKIKRKISRPGVVAKTKNAKRKNSRNYKKPYRGQGR
jgi:hypothetical protein